jgi:hypothetical protein
VIGFSSHVAPDEGPALPAGSTRRTLEISPHDRRFLRSLRIAADEATEEVE